MVKDLMVKDLTPRQILVCDEIVLSVQVDVQVLSSDEFFHQ